MKIQTEAFTRWSREAVDRGLFEAHWRELCRDADKLALDPDLEKYFAMEKMGALASFTVRDDDAQLAGFATFLCTTHPHYRSHSMACSDLVYLRPAYRGRGWGSQLLQFAFRELAGRGVSMIHVLAAKDSRLEILLEGAGFRHVENAWEKLLV